MTSAAVEPFPIDFTKLEKGQTIPADEISRIYGVDSRSPQFSFKVMSLVRQIEDSRRDLVTKQDHGSIRILTDIEASDYLEQRAGVLVGSLRRNASRVGRINTAEFSDAQKQLHSARERMAIGVAMAAEKERRSVLRELIAIRTELISAGDDEEEIEREESFDEVG